MKQLLFILLVFILLVSCFGLEIGKNEYKITNIELYEFDGYKYILTLKAFNRNDSWFKVKFYTNNEYKVGDILELTKIEENK